MNNHHFFRYVTGNSKIHLMSSKYKTLWLLLSLAMICFVNQYIYAAFVSIFLLYMMIMSKIDIKTYIENVLVLWPLYIIVLILSYVITFNVFVSVLLFIKIILIVLLLLIYTFTTSLSEIAWGFECLFEKLKKIKIPVSKISLRIALIIKFISTLFEQLKTIRKSMAYRGISYGEKGISTTRRMFMPVVRLSYKLSLRTISTMKLRFYGASKQRTNYHENKVTKFDKIILVISIILLYLVLWMGWII